VNKPLQHASAMLVIGTLALSGCGTQPQLLDRVLGKPRGQPTGHGLCGTVATPVVPAGIDMHRLQLLDENKRPALYTEVSEVDLDATSKQQLPERMRQVVDLSPSQFRRLFADAVASSRRFAVFDQRATALTTNAFSTVMVDLQVTAVTQDGVNVEPGRKVIASKVSMSVQMKDMNTGQHLLQGAITVEGRTGIVSGARRVYSIDDDWNSPDMKRLRGDDFVDAIKDAMLQVRDLLEAELRPMTKVLAVDGCQVGMGGGSKFGLAPGDDLVIFRPTFAQQGGQRMLVLSKPIARVNCPGVGTDTSQCTVTQLAKDAQPGAGDYAVVTDESLRRARPR
jgi:hypothetical protein